MRLCLCPSQVTFLFIIIISILFNISCNAQSKFCNAICLQESPLNSINVSNVERAYLESINTIGQDLLDPIIITNTVSCISEMYDGISDPCYDCCFDIDNGDNILSEDERWNLLFFVNEEIDIFAKEIESRISQNITNIRYGQADHVSVNSECSDLSYPRFCQLSLSNRSGDQSIFDQFYVSIALNVTSNIVTFRAGYDITNIWFGFALSTDQILPQPMEGYALVWSSGLSNGNNLEFAEYDLTGLNNVNRQSIQDLDLIQNTNIDGIIIYEFQRDFNTGNANDFEFDGTEIFLNVFGAVGNIISGTLLSTHDETNFCRAKDVLLVPSPANSDIFWCDPQSPSITNCFNVLITSDPTSDPTNDPTTNPTTASPTTASPTTASPTTASPTTASPTTASPTTTSPTTASPTTTSPTTASPTTNSPTTTSPTTAAPTTAAIIIVSDTISPTSSPSEPSEVGNDCLRLHPLAPLFLVVFLMCI